MTGLAIWDGMRHNCLAFQFAYWSEFMPLSDVEIKEALDSGEIGITPFDKKCSNQPGYDLKIGVGCHSFRPMAIHGSILEKEGILFRAYAPAVIFTLGGVALLKVGYRPYWADFYNGVVGFRLRLN